LGVEFQQEAEAVLQKVRENPELFGFVGKRKRLGQVHRFPYGIIYQAFPEKVLVLAVAHLHRNPDYWKGRA
jgi:hypothetical protein